MERKDLVRDMTLMLMYLTSWEEDTLDGTALRAWKSFDWDAMDSLREDGLVSCTNKAKSAWLTKAGAKKARELLATYETAIEMPHRLESLVDDVGPKLEDAAAFRFRIDLDLGGRECWREVVVPKTASFSLLHEVIQASLLWWDYHMYDFKLRTQGVQCEISDPARGCIDAMFSFDAGLKKLDAHTTALDEVFPRTRTATYSYDYGDGWTHRVKLVESIPRFEGEMPVCTDGAGDAPPEDVGGAWGFERFLKAITDESDPECESMREWGASQGFERFSLEAVNERMRKWGTGELFDEPKG